MFLLQNISHKHNYAITVAVYNKFLPVYYRTKSRRCFHNE